MSGYKITNCEGRQGREWTREYAAYQDASEAIRRSYGWDDIALSPWFATTDGNGAETLACCAYPSPDACEADQDGAYAPRIVRL